MGRVFEYEDIAGGLVPQPTDFEIAKQTFNKLTEQGVGKELFTGGFIFGSVAVGLAGPRSDFDAFICLNDHGIEAYQEVSAISRAFTKHTKSRIPFSPIIQTADALSEGRHEMDRLFGEHLSSPHRLIIGQDPAPIIKYDSRPAERIMADYVANKKRRLSNAYSAGFDKPEEALIGIQRMLELPVAIGRKALQAFHDAGLLYTAVERSADKRAVLMHSQRLMEELGLEEGFEDIIEADSCYQEALDEVLGGSMSKRAYHRELTDLLIRIPNGLIWLDLVETELIPKLR